MATITNNSTGRDNPSYCANPGCHCKVEAGKKYCCVDCEKQLDANDSCSCGHSNCQHEQKEQS